MNTKKPECSVEEENTERLIGRANRLGYTITSIEIEPGRVAISIVPSPLFPYTPELDRDFETDQWRVQTTAYGALNLDNIEQVTEGYGRAAAMVRELEHATPGNVVNYHLTR